jgi:hypothetical protein
MPEAEYLAPLEVLECLEKNPDWNEMIASELGADFFDRCRCELSEPNHEEKVTYSALVELICGDGTEWMNNRTAGAYYATARLLGHDALPLYWVENDDPVAGFIGDANTAITYFADRYLTEEPEETEEEEEEDEEEAEEEADNRPVAIYLPFINMYSPIKASCRSCLAPTTFGGKMRLNTDSGLHILNQYQCQDCGKLSYSGEQTEEEGIQMAVSEPCDCGGQRRRDKNIFCPSCAHRKSEDNRREEHLCISEEQFEGLRERHLKKFNL